MYNSFNLSHCPYFTGMPAHAFNTSGCPYIPDTQMYNAAFNKQFPGQYFPHTNQANPGNPIILRDYGPEPFAVDIEEAAKHNNNFRLALWTGKHLQITLMSINVGEDIGLEIHPNLDQFIRIEEGRGIIMMGDSRDRLDFRANVRDDYAFVIPAGKWHNLVNTGSRPLKLYSIYAPPQHPHGTVHKTREEAGEHH
ncbi:MAG: cupin domain-containing protein [Acetivibrionales bacterium]|jgi:mannose-6-phosphate isomerase-like protein (cupin superfamily)